MTEPLRLTVKGWRIWYVDGNVVSSRDMAWEQAPDTGILHVVIYFEPNPVMTAYVITGLEVYPRPDSLKYGATTSWDKYHDSLKSASKSVRCMGIP